MSSYRVDPASRPGVLCLTLEGSPSAEDMAAFVEQHNEAIRQYQGAPYRVFCDLRTMLPLEAGAAELFQHAKAFSSAQPNFQGSAVLVASSVVAMQHRRTSVAGGVMSTELISDSEAACWAHLKRIRRSAAR